MSEIPIKKNIRINQLIKKNHIGLKTQINDVDYVGTGYFFIKEELAPKNFITTVNRLKDLRIIENIRISPYYNDYLFSEYDADCELRDEGIYFKSGTRTIAIDHIQYSYFKKRFGVELAFNDNSKPIGMFKDREFIGAVMPIKVKEVY